MWIPVSFSPCQALLGVGTDVRCDEATQTGSQSIVNGDFGTILMNGVDVVRSDNRDPGMRFIVEYVEIAFFFPEHLWRASEAPFRKRDNPDERLANPNGRSHDGRLSNPCHLSEHDD